MHSLRRPPSRCPPSTKFCMWGGITDIFLGFKFHSDQLINVEAVGGRYFGLPIDLAHRLYNSRDNQSRLTSMTNQSPPSLRAATERLHKAVVTYEIILLIIMLYSTCRPTQKNVVQEVGRRK